MGIYICTGVVMVDIVQETDRSDAGSVKVWYGITIDGGSDFVVVRGRLNALRLKLSWNMLCPF